MTKKRIVVVAAIQNTASRDLGANLEKAAKKIELAAKRGAKIICLQELYRTIYFPQYKIKNFPKYAENIPGESTKTFSLLAKKYGAVIIAPLFEKTKDGHFYNSAVVINEKGKVLDAYRKIHIPHDPGFYEKDYFEASNSGYKIYKTKYATFAVLICYDQWFPEAARCARLAGAELIFYPTALGDIIGYLHPNDWHEAWETIIRGHAIANSVGIIAVNRTGREGNVRFFGQSFISDAWGKILKKASKNKEEILIQRLDLEYNKFLSEGWGFLRNRRPDTYASILSNRLVKKTKKLADVAHYEDEREALRKKY